MPRFFFDIDDGDRLTRDDIGVDLVGLVKARLDAISRLPQVADSKLPDGEDRRFVATVRDDHGTVVYRATLTFHGEWLESGS